MKFDNISDLRKRYNVKASFYKRNNLLFRNYADIIKSDYRNDKIDAYIIMMNPGSCEPINKDVDFTNSHSPDTAIYIDSKSDRAQKRVMQLMDNMKYNKTRILNLFDYKEPNSRKASQIINKSFGFPISIFSTERKEELNKLTIYDSPYIVAYGLGGLDKYKKTALEFLKNKNTYGVKQKRNNLGYYYLSPPNEKRAQEIITQIVTQIKNQL